jgi:hypothetical protein
MVNASGSAMGSLLTKRRRPLIEEIEPRILYSADLSPVPTPLPVAETRTIEASGEFSAHVEAQQGAAAEQQVRHEIVFVETNTPDYQKLADDIQSQATAQRQIDVVLLDASRDGIRQISQALDGRTDISAIHLISHGADGEVQLGTATLNFDSLVKNAAQIKGWGEALTSGADLLIYGCDVAQHADGRALVDALSRLTGADVAASENVTGAADQGGDWTLEYQDGEIETAIAISADGQVYWHDTLSATAQAGETRVNTTTSGTQQTNVNVQPRTVAMDSSGNYVVVWQGNGATDGAGIYAQRYNASGAAQGSEFRVNATTSGTQSDPAVAMDANGNFVVAWTSNGQDGSGDGVYAQRFNAAGVAQGGEFRVNTNTSGNQRCPVIAMNANGTFVIGWDSTGQDGSGEGVYAKRYNASGVAQGSEFRVNVTTANDQWCDSAAMDASGNFIIAFSSGDGNGLGVFTRRYDAAGNALTGEVRVNTTTSGDQTWDSVAMNASGEYVVAWNSMGQDGSGVGIYAQRFDANGVAQGSEFRVNTTTAGDQVTATVGIDNAGNFVITWSSYIQDAGSSWGVYKQDYNADGTTFGGETRVNTTTAGDQQYAGVAMNGVGQYVVIWSGNGSGDADGVFFQRYTSGLVVDTTSNTADGTTTSISALLSNKGADGKISLREAITAANNTANNGGADRIYFNISGSKTINIATQLPNITDAVIIDGTTQSGYTGTPLVELAGTVAEGLYLDTGSSGSTIKGLVLNGFHWAIDIAGSSNNVVSGNFLGTDATGTTAKGNWVGVWVGTSNNTIGGTNAADRNIISGNTVDGIQISGSTGGSGNVVLGNYIGLDVTGTADLGNTNQGIAIYNGGKNNTIGGTANGAANVISGNNGEGVRLINSGTTGNVVLGNLIGTNAAGTAGIANNRQGVWVDAAAANNTIGGTAAGAGNTIAYNTLDGVALNSTAGNGNAVLGNAIFSNGGLGIDLNDNGVTTNDANDADTGSNGLQNYPLLSYALADGAHVMISGSLNSVASKTYRLEFFSNTAQDASGHGEAQTYLGFANVTTDISGNATFNATFTAPVSPGAFITATATDPTNSTSEFSTNVVAISPALTVDTTSDVADGNTSSIAALLGSKGADGKISLREAITAANNTADGAGGIVDLINFAIAGVGVQTITLTSALPTITDAVIIDASTQTGFAGTPLIELNGNNAVANAFNVNGGGGSTLSGFAINRFTGDAVVLTTGGNTITGSYIGTNAAGTAALGNGLAGISILAGSNNNAIGGTTAAERNIISGNGTAGGNNANGITVRGNNNLIEGNYIGVAADGVTVFGNVDDGVDVTGSATNNQIGGSGAGQGNIVAGSGQVGVKSQSTSSGTNITGNAIFSNGGAGVRIQDTSNADRISQNSIYGNGSLGIDLRASGDSSPWVTPNDVGDVDTGPNNLKNYPVITSATSNAGTISISGTLNSIANTAFRIELFANTTADPSGSGEGERYLGFVNVTTDGSGNASFTANISGALSSTQKVISATTIETSSGNTSEFSAAFTATVINAAPVLSGANNLTATNEDPSSNPGTLVSALIAGKVTDSDPGALTGIAVTAVVNTNGTWQYSTNGGAAWTAFGSPTSSSARLLAADANTYVRFVPNANWNGTVSNGITFRAWDQYTGSAGSTADTTTNGGTTAFSSATASASISVNSVNDAPAGTSKTVTTLEDTAYTFATTDFGFTDANDSPANNLAAVKISALPGAGGLTLSGVAVTAGQTISTANITAGNLKFAPAANVSGAGYASFTFQVQDDGGTSNGGVDLDQTPNTITVNVTSVNDAPAGTNKTVTTLEDTAYTFAAADFGFTDANDSPANNLTAVKISALPVAGGLTLSGVAVTAGQTISAASIGSGNLKFVPAANGNGAGYASFTFQVQDDGGTSNSGLDLDQTPNTITVNVTSVNDAPGGANKTVTTLEDTAYTFASADFGFTDGSDSPANNLTAVKVSTLPGAGGLTLSGVAVTAGQTISAANIAAGNLKFAPGANRNGAGYASFTFQVQDDGGTANGGVDLDPTPNTITVNVTSVNDAPAGTNKTVTTLEDAAYTFAAADFGFTDASDSPVNNLTAVKISAIPAAGGLTLSGVAVTAGQTISAANITAGNLKFTPAANVSGAGYASFTFQVQDDGGTANGGVDLDQTPNTITVNVTSVNDAPAGTNKTITTLEDAAYTFATIDFGFSDANDSPANNLLGVRISALPVTGTLTLSGIAVTAGQTISTANIASGNFKFTPARDANGATYASFTFQVQDDGGTANGGVDLDQTPNTITFNVTSVNDAPAGTNKTVTTLEDTAYTFAATDFGFADVNDSPANNLTAVKISTVPAVGSLTLSGVAITAGQTVSAANIASGNLKFAAAANANGAAYASFTFQVQDDGGTANGGVDLDQTPNTMTVDVTSVNDAPAGTNKTVTTTEDTAYTFAAADFGFTDATDSPANNLTAVKIATLPAAGSLTLSGIAVAAGQTVSAVSIAAGNLKFTPAANANGAGYASFTFQVQDDGGAANGGVDLDQTPNTMTVNVTAVNDAPTNSAPSAQGTAQNTALVFSAANGNPISIADVDAAASPVKVTLSATNGLITLSGTGGLSFTAGNGTADATMTFTGTIANINAALDGLTFAPTMGYSGAASLAILTDDQGNTGSGGALTASNTVNITVNAVGSPTAASDSYSVNEDGALSVPWWNNSWTQRQQLTFNNNFANSDNLVDFPVLIKLNSGNIDYAQTAAGGADLRFFSANGSPLSYQIESWNTAGDSYIWVKVPQISANSSADSIWMYYGNAGAPAGQNAAAVWAGNGYDAVYHLDGNGVDSAAGGIDGSMVNGAASGGGSVVSAVALNGTNQYVNLGTNLPLAVNTSTVTLSAWINIGSDLSSGGIISIGRNNAGSPTSDSRVALEQSGSEIKIVARSTDDNTDVANIFTTSSPLAGQAGTWHYVTGVIDYATNNVAIYVDGVQQATTGTPSFSNTATPNTNSENATIGAQDDGSGSFFQGSIDEARIADTARSAGWVRAEYLSMTNSYVAFGGAQSAPAANGLLANDTSPSGQPLSAVLVNGPSNAAAFTLNADGTFVYTPNANFAGVDTFTYRATDGFTNSNTATVTITVNSINDAPAGTDKTITTLEDTAYTFSVADFGFTDPDDSPANNLLGVKISTLPSAGSLTLSGIAVSAGQTLSAASIAAGNLKFAPAADAGGTSYASFTFQLQDDGGTANSGVDLDQTPNTITLDVTSVNDAPAGTDKTVTTLEDTIYTFAGVDFGFTDSSDSPANSLLGVKIGAIPSAGGLTLSGVAVTAGQTISAANIAAGNLQFAPTADANGAGYASFTFQVQDDGGTANGGVDLDQTSNIITVNVTSVNDAPAGTDKTVTTLEDTAYTFTSADFGFTDASDAAANNLLGVKISALPGTGSLTLSGVAVSAGQTISAANIAAGNLKFTPAANANGTGYASFTFQVQDDGGTGNGGIDLDQMPNTITVDVTPVNDAPAGTNKTITALEDATYTFAAADFGFNDSSDSPADTLLSVKIATLPGAGMLTNNGIALNAGDTVTAVDIVAGNLKFAPAANASGAGYASFTFQVQDDGGTANGGIDLDQTPNTITVNVTSVNDAPAGTDKTVTAIEDTAYTFGASDFGFDDSSDTPADNLLGVKISALPTVGSLTLSGAAVSAGQTISAANVAAGNLKFMPAANATGAGYASFTFQVQDDGGTANGGVDLDQTPNTITLNVTSVNDAPAGTDKTIITLEDTAYIFASADFGFTDAGDGAANNLLGVKISTLPAAGTLTLSGVAVAAGQTIAAASIAAGDLQFAPAANANGAGYTSFTFQVQDDGGTANGGVDLDQTPNTITLNVTSVNDAPDGADKTVTTSEDTAYTFAVADFGFSDTADAPANALSAVKIGTPPSAGTLSNNGIVLSAGDTVTAVDIAAGNLKFAPAAGASGAAYATFTFQVQDDGGTLNGGVDTASTSNVITIDVTALNDAPAGADKTVTTLEDTAYTFATADFGFVDPNDAAADNLLGVKIGALPAAGSLTLSGVAVAAGQTISAVSIAAGNLKFVPAADASGPAYASFTFQVQDDGGTANGGVDLDQTPNTITVNVTAVNDAPTGTNNAVTTLEDTAYVFSAGDFGFTDSSDALANALAAIKITALPGAGTLTLAGVAITAGQTISAVSIASGNLQFTPAADANGAGYASFTFQVQDDGGTANGGIDLDPTPRTMSIDVTPVDDAPVLIQNTLTVSGGATVSLNAAELSATDVDDPVASLLFTVSGLTHGQFELTSAPSVAVLSFTQGQVAGGQVRFVHDASSSAPTYSISVSDGVASAGPNAAAISFSLPPIVATSAAGLPSTLPMPVASAPVLQAPVASSPIAPAAAAPLAGTSTAPLASARAERPTSTQGQAPTVAAPILLETATPRITRVGLLEIRHGAIPRETISIHPMEQSLLIQSSDPEYARIDGMGSHDWTVDSAFGDRSTLQGKDESTILFDSAQMGGIALSVGVVWWASRLTGVIGSLLTSLPAWRHLDPLPVIGRDDEGEESQWGQENPRDTEELAISLVLDGPRNTMQMSA